MKIALVPSTNGFGHFRRCLAISRELYAMGNTVSIIWNKKVQLPKWSRVSIKESGASLQLMNTPLDFDGYHGDKFESQIDTEVQKQLEKFDALISDTLTWPSRIGSHKVLFANFVWEVLYKQQLNKSSEVDAILDKLQHVPIIGMDFFAIEQLRKLNNFVATPIWDYWNLREKANEYLNEVVYSESGVIPYSHEISRWFRERNIYQVKGLEKYVEEKQGKPAGVFCRAGVGILSEAISLKTVPLMLFDDDLEIRANMSKVINNGIGMDAIQVINSKQKNLIEYLKNVAKLAEWPEIVNMENVVKNFIVPRLYN